MNDFKEKLIVINELVKSLSELHPNLNDDIDMLRVSLMYVFEKTSPGISRSLYDLCKEISLKTNTKVNDNIGIDIIMMGQVLEEMKDFIDDGIKSLSKLENAIYKT